MNKLLEFNMQKQRNILSILVFIILSCNSSQDAPVLSQDKNEDLVTFEDSLSYSLGIRIAQNLNFPEVNTDKVKLGMDDFLSQTPARIDIGRRNSILSDYNRQQAIKEVDSYQVATEEMRELARKNKIAGQEFMEKNKYNDGVLVRKRSGLQYRVLKEGDGPLPDYNSLVSVHYTGRLIDGTIFDSSLKNDKPSQFNLDKVIPGFSQAILTMKVGSKWEVFIPYNLAYGDKGIPGKELGTYVIPPASTLIFEIELIDILND